MSGLRPCDDCGRNVRPSKAKASDYPGMETMSYGSATRCTTCHRQHRKPHAPAKPKGLTLGDLNLEQNLASLGSFMARRQQRLARRQLGGVA